MPKPTRPPDWPPPKRRWPAGCCPYRDGWRRWYRGLPRHVCGKRTPLAEVEDRWIAVKRRLDAEADATARADALPDPTRAAARAAVTYRVVLSEFLTRQQWRVGAARDRIERRTYDNYVYELNRFGAFVHDGLKVADRPIDELAADPKVFTAYARHLGSWKASGFDSVVSRVLALFRWAGPLPHGMGYCGPANQGPDFRRPDKEQLRDERIGQTFSFTPAEVATLYLAANHTVRCWIAQGVCGGFINSDVAHVTRDVQDLAVGVTDFRRRKQGKVRRVIPWPDDVVELLRQYCRPDASDPAHADLFYLSTNGNPYSRTREGSGPSCSISRMFARLIEDAGVTKVRGRSFKGLRTTLYNRWPKVGPDGGPMDVERKIVMGRAQGTVDLDHYLEDVGLDRIRHGVNHVWGLVRAEIDRLSTSRAGATPRRPAGPDDAPPAEAGAPAAAA
ncbi:MAG TPA: hypothetical protein VK324_13785 [Tepidisphaeraceae bacterium]|nr:hypothetical protein [Tepidisphaeraceae bacterium]